MQNNIVPFPTSLPKSPEKIAAIFGDIVTALENHRTAFIELAKLDRKNTNRRYAVGELFNLWYELNQLCRAYGLSIEDLPKLQGAGCDPAFRDQHK